MSQYSEFFLAGRSDVIQYEMIEIIHNEFSQTWRLTRNGPDGLSAGGYVWTYCPMLLEPSSNKFDLDFGISVTLGDLGTIIPDEISALRAVAFNYGMLERPRMTYQTFASNELASPMVGPFELEIEDFALTRQGASFVARPLTVNRNKTGMLYSPDTFPSLKGFI